MKDNISNFFIQLTGWTSLVIPLSIGILNAAPESYWLDSPEFTAAAQSLGIPHPPGHPLYVLLVKPFTLLPIGTIPFRVSLASAVFGACASFILYKIIQTISHGVTDDVPPWIHALVACCGSLLASTSQGWWFQCVRQEVYSLQILIVLAALYPLIRYCLRPPQEDFRLLYLSAFIFGLGLSNHHFIMLCALPAAIPTIMNLAKGYGAKRATLTTLKMGTVASTGLLPYVFLPLRSAAGAPIALGGVHSVSDFFWVVSAKVYQKSMAKEHVQSLDDRSFDALYSMMSELGPIVVVVSIAGFYLLIRRKKTQLIGITVFLLGGVSLFLRAIMGFDPFNPDYYGYMLPTISAVVIAASIFATTTYHVIIRTAPKGVIIASILAIALTALPLTKAKANRQVTDLSQFNATRLYVDMSISQAQTGTIVLTSYYKIFFALWSAKHVDGSRPDIHIINPQLFGYPGYLAQIASTLPQIKQLAWTIFVKGKVTEAAVSNLALQFPLRIDPSPWTEERVFSHLIPDGPLYIATPEPLGTTDVQAAAPAHFEKWKQFYNLLGARWDEHETWRMLSWSHYLDAVFFARRGDRESAQQAIDLSKTVGAATTQINGLEDALKQTESGPIDVTPFLLESTDSDETDVDTDN